MRQANFNLEELTRGISTKNRKTEVKRLVEKWEVTGLLNGLGDHRPQLPVRGR